MSKNLGIKIGSEYKKSKIGHLKSIGWGLAVFLGGIAFTVYTLQGDYVWYVTAVAIGLTAMGAWMLYGALFKCVKVSVYEHGIKITEGKNENDILFSDMTDVNWYTRTSSKEGDTTTLTIGSKGNKVISIDSDSIENISSLCQKVEDTHFQLMIKDITPENIAQKTISFGYAKLENGAFVQGKKRIPLTQFDRYAIENGDITFYGFDGTKINYSITLAANLKVLLHLVNDVISYYKQQNGVLSV